MNIILNIDDINPNSISFYNPIKNKFKKYEKFYKIVYNCNNFTINNREREGYSNITGTISSSLLNITIGTRTLTGGKWITETDSPVNWYNYETGQTIQINNHLQRLFHNLETCKA